MNQKVDLFISKSEKWQKEFERLRMIVLDCGLKEDFKWGVPCYTFQDRNMVLVHGFENYCAMLFINGALLGDSHGILIQQTENTRAARQVRFTEFREIVEIEATLKAYLYEAIEAEKAGLKVDFQEKVEPAFPEELQKALETNAAFKTAFHALTPGRQRAYNMFFTAPKQTKTRESRVEKYTQRILDGYGMNDCTCGFSKKMPNCDGSHKYL